MYCRICWNLSLQNSDTHTRKLRLGKGPKKKNYESSDICPNWVYPTYLVAKYGLKKVWTSTPIVYPTYLSKKFGHFWIEVCP